MSLLPVRINEILTALRIPELGCFSFQFQPSQLLFLWLEWSHEVGHA